MGGEFTRPRFVTPAAINNPWLEIPLSDYEAHMALATVGQAEMLARQFETALTAYAPRSVAVIGCAGGNGFERVSAPETERLVGVDINPDYVAETSRRFAGLIPGLELYCADIQRPLPEIAPVELVYAGLVFEYVDVAAAMATIRSLCAPNGVLVSVLQLPSESIAVVSPSPFPSLRRLAPAMKLVPPSILQAEAERAGFVHGSTEVIAPHSDKKFAVQAFRAV